MKVAISAMGRDQASHVDPRFGRAKYFVVVDTDTDEATAHDNAQNLNAAQGAGVQAGAAVVRLGVTAVVTGNVGPKAFRVLNAAGIKVYLSGNGSVADAVRRLKEGGLKEATGATVEGHWA